jgi:hypothetical protein
VTGDLEVRQGAVEPFVVALPGVTVQPLGLSFTEILAYEEWRALGLNLGLSRDWTGFAIGDWLVSGG